MMKDNVIMRVAAKILFAPIIVFGLYVQFHGDYGPGGGFQAGVIIAAAFILHALVFGLAAGRKLVPLWLNIWLLAAGVLIYGAVGIVSMMQGGLYLDYNVLAQRPADGQHIGILVVEFGVGLTVTTVMLLLFHAFAGYSPRAFQSEDPEHGHDVSKHDKGASV
jgi:multicomponent Na+:H+ antiporter subunit B